jgi:hypothetical protein
MLGVVKVSGGLVVAPLKREAAQTKGTNEHLLKSNVDRTQATLLNRQDHILEVTAEVMLAETRLLVPNGPTWDLLDQAQKK